MRGAGTSRGITIAERRTRLLDVTRLVSRAGQGAHTGIDRVEHAYLKRLLGDEGPLFGLLRSALGYLLLDRAGLERLARGAPWGAPDLFGRVAWRNAPDRAAAEATLRRIAIARCRPRGLGQMLGQLPAGLSYLNTGHTNLTGRTLSALKAAGAQVTVLVHDTIPLDHPEFTRAGIPDRFAAKLRAVSARADLVICSSQAVAADVTGHMGVMGRVPPLHVAPLGVEVPRPDATALPPGFDLTRPWFVAVGTIEPRKNLSVLLDAWEILADLMPPEELPRLILAGRRGWCDRAFFDRLDATGPEIVEAPNLPDPALFALVQGARATLFPSLAEGFGLPPLESMALNTPVAVTDLPVYRETLGDFAVYLTGADAYSWVNYVQQCTGAQTGRTRDGVAERPRVPTWDGHFSSVLNLA